ncbi:MAG TPA: GTPase HflX [Armatimonadota bacterium]|jgi:GTP-binding protein HflX
MAPELAPDRSSSLTPPERALLIGVEPFRGATQYALEELGQLVEAAGMEPVQVMVQTRPRAHPLSYFGKGKVKEVAALIAAEDLEIVVVNAELSARQVATLSERLEVRVLDRTEVILEIFSRHAHTPEGRLQVELARLEYLLPRLIGRGQGMSQIAGGRAGMTGVRGPGETRLELDRRLLRRKMTRLRHSLEDIRQRREVERAERRESGQTLVGLVGYTNAGKSSLLNALAGTQVVTANDRLFETLDTTIRRIDLGEGAETLVSDTVGFINDLPTDLVSAFRATLEETGFADLLILIVDAADERVERQLETVEEVLGDLKVLDKPRLLVLNKWDRLDAQERRDLQTIFPRAIPISATTGEGLDELREELRRRLTMELVPLTLHLPYNRLQLMHFPASQGRVLSSDYQEDYVLVRVRVQPRLVDSLRQYVVNEA